METKVDILMQQKLKNGDKKIMYPVTKMSNILIEKKDCATEDKDGPMESSDKTKLNKLDISKTKTITLVSASWTLNEGTQEYEYDIKDTTITENHRVDLILDNKNQKKFSGNVCTNSYNGGFKIITENQPEEDITGDLSIIKHENIGGDV